MATSRIDSHGTPYDYDSMMHYGSRFFTDGGLTIETKYAADQDRIGQRRGFSATDVKQINLMYCDGTDKGMVLKSYQKIQLNLFLAGTIIGNRLQFSI